MCPAGPEGWHLVENPVSIDRHSGKEVTAAAPEEENVPKKQNGSDNLCPVPGCGRAKRGRAARDGQPCFACRKGRKRPGPVAVPTPPAPSQRQERPARAKRTIQSARFEDKQRVLTLTMVQRPAPKTGGDPFLVRWKITGAKGARKMRPVKGVAATAGDTGAAEKAWAQVLRKAEASRWTRVEAPAKRGRELQIEMFPPAVGTPKRRAA